MENLEVIISLAGTAFGLIIAILTVIIKFVKTLKASKKEQGKTYLLDTISMFVEAAEEMTNYSGKEKKEYVITKANQFAISNGIEFDVNDVSDKIETLIQLSKHVNKKKGDKENAII